MVQVLCVYDANTCDHNARKDGVGGVVLIGLPNARHKLEDYKSPHGIDTEIEKCAVGTTAGDKNRISVEQLLS